MSRRDKLIKRLTDSPKDLSFDELVIIMKYFGYTLNNRGNTSGSAIKFTKDNCRTFYMHKPHAYKYLLDYQVRQVLDFFKGENIL